MPNVRINQLPADATPTQTDVLPIDGSTTRKVTIKQVAEIGRPAASQAEAEAGTDPTKAMAPLTVKQSIASEVGVSIASKAQGDKADTAVQPADLSTVATTGVYSDLSGKPTLGSAAAADTTDFATAAQGAKADLATTAAATRVALKAAGTTSPAMYLREAGREGWFTLIAGTAPVTDTNEAVYITSDTAGYYWKRDFSGPINLSWFEPAGDGATSDHDKVEAARTLAGITGEVYYPDGTYLIDDIDLPQAKASGPGLLKLGDVTWKAAEAQLPHRMPARRFELTATVDDDLYSHFPASYVTPDGRIVITYTQGRNHGQADVQAVCLPQTLASAGDFTINGNDASGGTVTLAGTDPLGSRVQIISSGDDSAITFTVSGTVDGAATTEDITGTNASTAQGTKFFTVITGVAASGATAGDVSVGLRELPSDIKMAVSSDGGRSFDITTIGDGMTEGRLRYYQTSIAAKPDGDGVILLQKWDIVNTAGYVVRRSLDGFRTLGPEEEVTLDFTPSGTLYFYGDIKVTPSGRYFTGAYTSTKEYILMSDDGVSWTSSLIVEESGTGYSELAILILGSIVLALVRIDGTNSAMRIFRSLDVGSTWTNLGATNLTVGGGYVSPQLGALYGPGDLEAVMVLGSRQSSAGEVDPNAIIARYGSADSVDSLSTGWSGQSRVVASFAVTEWAVSQTITRDEYRLASDDQTYRALQDHTTSATDEPNVGANWEDYWVRFNPRGGYPTLHIDPLSGDGFVAYGKETGYRKSQIEFKRFNWRGASLNDYYAKDQVWTPTLIGKTAAGTTVLGTAYGRWSRVKNMVFLEFDIRVTGSFDGTGTIQIGGAPFSIKTANTPLGKVRVTNAGTLTGVAVQGVFGTTPLLELSHDTSGGYSVVDASEIGSGFTVKGSIVYMTDD